MFPISGNRPVKQNWAFWVENCFYVLHSCFYCYEVHSKLYPLLCFSAVKNNQLRSFDFDWRMYWLAVFACELHCCCVMARVKYTLPAVLNVMYILYKFAIIVCVLIHIHITFSRCLSSILKRCVYNMWTFVSAQSKMNRVGYRTTILNVITVFWENWFYWYRTVMEIQSSKNSLKNNPVNVKFVYKM